MTGRLTLRAAFAEYPHVLALKDGRVASDRVGFDFERVEPITRAFRRMVRTADFDLCEIALTTHAQAHAYGKAITALPVVLMRGFHHGALVCPLGSPLSGPRDLRGKRVGVRAFSQTTGVWVRGILKDEYGVDHRDITWVTQEDAHVQEYRDPVNVVRTVPGQDLAAMLLAGEIDAGIALAGLDPSLARPVIADAEAEAAAWHRRTGAYPVNHVVCVKTPLLRTHPWLAGELFRLFSEAKRTATGASAEARYAPLVGDPLPYGLAANRAGIELCLRYAAEQRLVPAVYRPEELFAALG
jgi:4,5-dihydroxyphthalate decarboxylase